MKNWNRAACGVAMVAFGAAANAANADEIVAEIYVSGATVRTQVPTDKAIAAYYAGGATVRTSSSGGTDCPTIKANPDSKPDLTRSTTTLVQTVGKQKADAIKAAGCVVIRP